MSGTAPKNCGQPCEVYSRVVGYFRPVQFWNPGKKQEFKDRVNFKVNGGAYGSDDIGKSGVVLGNFAGQESSWAGQEERLRDNEKAEPGPGTQERDGQEKPEEKPEGVNHE